MVTVPIAFPFRGRCRSIYLPRYIARWFASAHCNQLWSELLRLDRFVELWLRTPLPCSALSIEIHNTTLSDQLLELIAKSNRLAGLELIDCDFSLSSLTKLKPISSELCMAIRFTDGTFMEPGTSIAVAETLVALSPASLALGGNSQSFPYWIDVAKSVIRASGKSVTVFDTVGKKQYHFFHGESCVIVWDNLNNIRVTDIEV